MIWTIQCSIDFDRMGSGTAGSHLAEFTAFFIDHAKANNRSFM